MTLDTLPHATPFPVPPPGYTYPLASRTEASQGTLTLPDLLHDGFYLILLLKNKYVPTDALHFATQVQQLLDAFERNARRLDISADDVYAAKYAFCAAVDEAVLASDMSIRDTWERAPLQLTLFGDQLAGEHFFNELEEVRRRGTASVQTLEVFHMCLLTGFQGKYMLESKEKLNYLIATLDKEIAHLKGRRAPFAPHWKAPDNIVHMVKAELPMWVIAAAFTFLGIAVYAALSWNLSAQVNDTLNIYFDVIKLTPKVANITISLP
ncbi:type IVB secretion system protein IcmH/DotU [Noviherbaspirillum saxi]|uniref:DotU family type IV/VI secretion system protein n=1 Tax=Noviherbaspirillum saxi TaxID=2320863 RepID=A0A3A3FMY8_9BURK|nr:type IVB secretion system protein IcmH/DotU [Noviherbaspirillum saxi]RJF95835.1 DotU family type IV/VI secretion system protein [Noviherbaspirillum saxi]